jgi:hypothetical protein
MTADSSKHTVGVDSTYDRYRVMGCLADTGTVEANGADGQPGTAPQEPLDFMTSEKATAIRKKRNGQSNRD